MFLLKSLDDNETNLSQSEIDIQKVQLKLLNLEKSLDKLTLKETNVELKQSMTNIWDELVTSSYKIFNNPKHEYFYILEIDR